MYITVGLLVLIFIGITLGRILYYRNWTLIYSAFGNEEYFFIIAKLKAEGIKYRTSIPNRGFGDRLNRFKDATQYDIYVKKEEEHIAINALHKRN